VQHSAAQLRLGMHPIPPFQAPLTEGISLELFRSAYQLDHAVIQGAAACGRFGAHARWTGTKRSTVMTGLTAAASAAGFPWSQTMTPSPDLKVFGCPQGMG